MKRTFVILIIIIFVVVFSLIATSGRNDTIINSQENIYTVEATLYATTPEGTQVLEDEAGTLWEVTNENIADNDIILIQLDNNNTPKDNTDDVIINLWKLMQNARYTYNSTGFHTPQEQITDFDFISLAG